MSEKRDEIFSIKQVVAIKTENKRTISVSVFLSNIRLVLKFKTGKIYSVPINNLSNLIITDNQFIKLFFNTSLNIPELSSQSINYITIAQIAKNIDGKPIVTTSTIWVNNWIEKTTGINKSIYSDNYKKQTFTQDITEMQPPQKNTCEFGSKLTKSDYSKSKIQNYLILLKKSLFSPLAFKDEILKLSVLDSLLYFLFISSIIVILVTMFSLRWEPILIIHGFFNAFFILLITIIGLKVGHVIAKKDSHNKSIILYSIYGSTPIILFAWILNIWPIFFIWMLAILFIWIGNGFTDSRKTATIVSPLVLVLFIFLALGYPFAVLAQEPIPLGIIPSNSIVNSETQDEISQTGYVYNFYGQYAPISTNPDSDLSNYNPIPSSNTDQTNEMSQNMNDLSTDEQELKEIIEKSVKDLKQLGERALEYIQYVGVDDDAIDEDKIIKLCDQIIDKNEKYYLLFKELRLNHIYRDELIGYLDKTREFENALASMARSLKGYYVQKKRGDYETASNLQNTMYQYEEEAHRLYSEWACYFDPNTEIDGDKPIDESEKKELLESRRGELSLHIYNSDYQSLDDEEKSNIDSQIAQYSAQSSSS